MKCKLFCLPYAGGSATVYTRWKRHLHGHIELHPVELAGRGKRLLEPPYGSMDELVEDLYEYLDPQLDEADFAFFGHSMGALVAYELAHAVRKKRGREPVHLFVSGTYPPHARRKLTLHLLSDERLQQEIRLLGGTEDELFEREELLRMFLPGLRRDLELVETHAFQSGAELLSCNISVLNGKEDTATEGFNLLEWSAYGSRGCQLYEFEGGHFFINEHTEQVVSLINDVLGSPVERMSTKKES
ncbi:thioesterase II family protein [Paenibacillus sp. UNC499MF]|uniref:thioesterase II family protein n=1 Tax=Paenibacillus sp. UNC499MF TaxID=1502751 RepID=UPI0008A096A2|nr:alpha/beta fold hydrolase [Paenibacillus sp. UNC499MF]SEG58976.1 Surfactin synthase thioesterase subunit [Paenibacillus sp. UNC499MF]